MERILSKIEFIIVLIIIMAGSVYTFINGYTFLTMNGFYNMLAGIITILSSIALLVLAFVYYKFYELCNLLE